MGEDPQLGINAFLCPAGAAPATVWFFIFNPSTLQLKWTWAKNQSQDWSRDCSSQLKLPQGLPIWKPSTSPAPCHLSNRAECELWHILSFQIYKCDWDFFKKLTYGAAINATQQEFSENSRLLSQTRPDADASGVLGNQLEVYRMLSESAGGFILHLPSVQDPWFAAQTSPHIF